MQGFIKIHRVLTEWEWYTEANTLRVFLHLLLMATHKQINWKGIELMPGQLITGRIKLAHDLKLSEQEIRTSLTRLKSTNEITIKTTNKFSIITICKYCSYQDRDIDYQPAKQPTEQPTSNQQITTYKNVKNVKKIERGQFAPPSLPEIQKYFAEKIAEKGLRLNPKSEAEKFESFYASKGWLVGKAKMKDWKKSVSGWIARSNDNQRPQINGTRSSSPQIEFSEKFIPAI